MSTKTIERLDVPGPKARTVIERDAQECTELSHLCLWMCDQVLIGKPMLSLRRYIPQKVQNVVVVESPRLFCKKPRVFVPHSTMVATQPVETHAHKRLDAPTGVSCEKDVLGLLKEVLGT